MKPTQDAEPAKGVLDEREAETATLPPGKERPPIRSPLEGLRGQLAEGLSMGLHRVQGGRVDAAGR